MILAPFDRRSVSQAIASVRPLPGAPMVRVDPTPESQRITFLASCNSSLSDSLLDGVCQLAGKSEGVMFSAINRGQTFSAGATAGRFSKRATMAMPAERQWRHPMNMPCLDDVGDDDAACPCRLRRSRRYRAGGLPVLRVKKTRWSAIPPKACVLASPLQKCANSNAPAQCGKIVRSWQAINRRCLAEPDPGNRNSRANWQRSNRNSDC